MRRFELSLVAIILGSALTSASLFGQDLPAGKLIQIREIPEYPLGKIPVNDWKGKQFRINPPQGKYWSDFRPILDRYSLDTLSVLVVTKYQNESRDRDRDDSNEYVITFQDRRTRETFIYDTRNLGDQSHWYVPGITPLRDLERASHSLVDKPTWVSPWSESIWTFGGWVPHEEWYLPFTQMTVREITPPSHETDQYSAIITRPPNDTIYYRGNFSATNVRAMGKLDAFGRSFLIQEPKHFFDVVPGSLSGALGCEFGEASDKVAELFKANGLHVDTMGKSRIPNLRVRGDFGRGYPVQVGGFYFDDTGLYEINLTIEKTADTANVLKELRSAYGAETRQSMHFARNWKRSTYDWAYYTPGEPLKTIRYTITNSESSKIYSEIRFQDNGRDFTRHYGKLRHTHSAKDN